jgi:phosphonate transport system substrate-binding protein
MRALTYLAPGIPLGFYEVLAHHLSRALDESVDVASDPRFSGPPPDEPNPLVDGEIDLAFVCGPSYLRLADQLQLVPIAPVFDDPRTPGRPQYFAEVVVSAERPERSLTEMSGARFVFNDPASLSGRLAVLAHLGSMSPPQFAQALPSGSSEISLQMIQAGYSDVCSIDSIVWRRLTTEQPELLERFRVIESLGPFPVQPVVASTRLDTRVVEAIAKALEGLGIIELGAFGATGFAPVSPRDYEPLAAFLNRLAP